MNKDHKIYHLNRIKKIVNWSTYYIPGVHYEELLSMEPPFLIPFLWEVIEFLIENVVFEMTFFNQGSLIETISFSIVGCYLIKCKSKIYRTVSSPNYAHFDKDSHDAWRCAISTVHKLTYHLIKLSKISIYNEILSSNNYMIILCNC